MERGIALYDRNLHASQASLYGGHDAGACCRYRLALNLWALGYPDRSLNALVDALHLADELNHPMTRVITLWHAAWVYYQRAEGSAMRTCVEQLLALTAELGISHWSGLAIILLKADEPLARHELVELHNRLSTTGGANWRRVFALCVLAEVYGKRHLVEDGLAVLASISAVDRGAFYAPEIRRLEGELRRRLPSSQTEEIECCFREAILLARERTEKLFELRAATSLARFWHDQGKCSAALELLTPIYNWFTEGLDLPDLKNARALINDLVRST
jgi:hypothetical protein